VNAGLELWPAQSHEISLQDDGQLPMLKKRQMNFEPFDMPEPHLNGLAASSCLE
jgi:hypothetical protein